MDKMLGYMITFTTYGTWLQGDKRGYVKDGEILTEDTNLLKANKSKLRTSPVILSARWKKIVQKAILEKAQNLGQNILALDVTSNHVHMVIECDDIPVEDALRYYKNAARIALRKDGFIYRLWTRGYDKRFCFTKGKLQKRIDYVKSHNK